MRNDFEYVKTVPINKAVQIARRRSKRTLLTGAMGAVLATGLWQAAVAMFALLAVTNIIQKKKPVGRAG